MKKYTPVFFVFALLITLLSFNAQPVSASNCAPGDLFNTATGQPCNTTQSSTDCASGDLFSSITGKSCTAVTSPTVPSCSIVPNIKIGSKGDNIKVLQSQLNTQGANLKVDGSYGPLTQAGATKYCKTPTPTPTSSCVSEGGSLGAVVPGNIPPPSCCSGLVAYIPENTVGTFGTCVKPSTTNQAPVISGVSGPTTLNVGQSGAWSVLASDPEQGTLSYFVSWGDIVSVTSSAENSSFVSTATFSHIYNNVGVYTVKFIAKDNQGFLAETTISVNVVASDAPIVPVVPKYKCSGTSCVQDDTNGTFSSSNCSNSCGVPPITIHKYKCSGTASCVQDDANGTFTSSNCSNACGTVAPPSSCTDTCENHGYQCGTHTFCGVTQNCGSCFQSGYSCQNNICVAGQTYFNTGIFNWGKVTDDKGKTNCESRNSFVCRSQSKYDVGQVVKFTAQVLDPIYTFNKWSSCACSDSPTCNLDVYGCGTGNPCTLTIPAPSGGLEPGIQACFKAPDGYKKLTVSGVSQGGYITSSVGGINVGIKDGAYLYAGTYHFSKGTSVTLTAHPGAGYKFYMWSGWKKNGVLAPGFSTNCSDNSGTCTLMLDEDRSLSFMFEPN